MPNSQPTRILLVDDDHEDAYATKRAFAKSGQNIAFDHFESGENLVDRLSGFAHMPDLILLDINMPRVDGFQVLRQIRESETLRHIPVIMFSTSQERSDIVKSHNLGASSFVTKPHSNEGMGQFVEHFTSYWMTLVQLPRP